MSQFFAQARKKKGFDTHSKLLFLSFFGNRPFAMIQHSVKPYLIIFHHPIPSFSISIIK